MSKLEDKFDQLIAKELGISPGEVTLELIQNYRRDNVDPEEKFDFSANTGGLNPPKMHVFSYKEIEDLRDRAEKFFDRYSRRK